MYVVRGTGGILYLTGALIMAYNLWMTVKRAPLAQPTAVAAPAE
jgi:cytochrome c oxidase cbb3-type subunit 1